MLRHRDALEAKQVRGRRPSSLSLAFFFSAERRLCVPRRFHVTRKENKWLGVEQRAVQVWVTPSEALLVVDPTQKLCARIEASRALRFLRVQQCKTSSVCVVKDALERRSFEVVSALEEIIAP